MAGYVGRWVIALSRGNMKLKRITALDPAGPMFYHVQNVLFLPIPLSFFDAEVIIEAFGTLSLWLKLFFRWWT